MNSRLIEGALHFSESYFEDKEITEQEMEYGRFFIRNIFNKSPDYDVIDSNINYGQLIKIAALANRYSRCCDALEYIMEGFQNNILPLHYYFYDSLTLLRSILMKVIETRAKIHLKITMY